MTFLEEVYDDLEEILVKSGLSENFASSDLRWMLGKWRNPEVKELGNKTCVSWPFISSLKKHCLLYRWGSILGLKGYSFTSIGEVNPLQNDSAQPEATLLNKIKAMVGVFGQMLTSYLPRVSMSRMPCGFTGIQTFPSALQGHRK